MARRLRALPLVLLCLALARSAWAAPPTITIDDPNDGELVSLQKAVAGKITADVPTDPNAPTTVKLRVDAGTDVTAQIFNTGYLGTVTLPSAAMHTITATITANGESASTSITVQGDPPPVIDLGTLLPHAGFVTGDVTIEVGGHITDNNLDPNDPDKLTANNASVPVDATNHFLGKAPLQLDSNPVRFSVRDSVGNVATAQVFGTRTSVCKDLTPPASDNNDPNKPHFIVVTRLDDVAMTRAFDPNAPDACDVHPNMNDSNDPNAPPPFEPPAGKCSLRAALQIANAHPGVDLIRLPNDTVTLTRGGAGEDAGLRGDLDVNDDLVVLGLGRDISIIDARKLKDRVFDVAEGVSFTIQAATVRGGQTPKKPVESGGCIRFAGGLIDPNVPSQSATFRANNLAMLDCKSTENGGSLEILQDPEAVLPTWDVDDPNAQDPNGISKITCGIVARSSAKKDGGGISVENGALVIRNSTIAFASSGGTGGAIAERGGTLVLKNTTLSANKAKSGGGLALASGATATVNNTTFAKNKAKKGVSVSTADETGGTNTLEVGNSILGDKPKNACDTPATSPVDSRGGNLDPGTSCDLTEGSDIENSNPLLDALATNVGIPTHALKPNSPAIDQGVFARCEPLDERNADRVDGPPDVVDPNDPNSPPFPEDQCDSGAFEFAATPSSP